MQSKRARLTIDNAPLFLSFVHFITLFKELFCIHFFRPYLLFHTRRGNLFHIERYGKTRADVGLAYDIYAAAHHLHYAVRY